MNDHERLWRDVQEAANRGDVEDTLRLIARWLQHDANTCGDELVRSLLESAAESCRSASFEYYASTK